MAGRSLGALIAVALVAGCGQAAEQAMSERFDEEFIASCVSAAQGGLPREQAQAACDCALDEINEKYSATEKVALSDEQALPIAEQCFAQVMGQADAGR